MLSCRAVFVRFAFVHVCLATVLMTLITLQLANPRKAKEIIQHVAIAINTLNTNI